LLLLLYPEKKGGEGQVVIIRGAAHKEEDMGALMTMVEEFRVAEVLAEDVILSILAITMPMIGKASHRNNALKNLEAKVQCLIISCSR
jgi:hypothetical protein